MEIKIYNVIGVMSGTSLDGIDLAYVRITTTPAYTAEILLAETVSYPKLWEDSLQNAHQLSENLLHKLNSDYTTYLADVINHFVKKNNLTHIDAVCSHGHTVLHQPEIGVTLQIGNLPELATLLGQKVVCDFRVQDVQQGGQGAPLVPIGDQLLFSEYDYCLNLGGFANVSLSKNGTRLAYDICPVNVVLNPYAQQLGKEYDAGGAFAKAGTVNTSLLVALNALPFYREPAPKSLGIEWVHEHIFPLIDKHNCRPKDVLATFTEHIAIQLSAQFASGRRVLVTGGGAYNSYLLERVRSCLTARQVCESVQLHIPENTLVEYKEALIFALLGVLRLEGAINVLSSVTGSSRDHSSGEIYLP